MQENNLCFLDGTATYGTVQLEEDIIDEISKLTASFMFSSSGLSLQKKKRMKIYSHTVSKTNTKKMGLNKKHQVLNRQILS